MLIVMSKRYEMAALRDDDQPAVVRELLVSMLPRPSVEAAQRPRPSETMSPVGLHLGRCANHDRYRALLRAQHPPQDCRPRNSPAERDHAADQQGVAEIGRSIDEMRERHTEELWHTDEGEHAPAQVA